MTVRLLVSGSGLLRKAGTLLTGCGVLATAACAWFLLDGTAYQYQQNLRFERQLANATPALPVSGTSPAASSSPAEETTPAALDPRIMGRLEIPALDMSVLVREGVDDTSLRKAVGHLPESASVGEGGNFVVLGHRDTFFRPLRNIAVHDLIRIRTLAGVFEYEVDLVAVTGPDEVLTLTAAKGATATLITCFPFSYSGPAPRRFVVRARLKDHANTRT